MKLLKIVIGILVVGLVGLLSLLCVREYLIDSSFPVVAGGELVSPRGLLTARSLAIIERSYFGKEHRYYRFELREGGSNNGKYGRILREVTMEPLANEDFRMPRAFPAFPLKWSDDESAVIFSGTGVEITLRK